MNSVDATIDLTTRENCLVCGAYESLAAGKPMILSKTRALMNYFSQAAVYVEHTAEDLERGIHEALKQERTSCGASAEIKDRTRARMVQKEKRAR